MPKCTICNSYVDERILTNLRDLEYATNKIGDIGKCKSCGLIQQVPMPSLEEALAFYPDAYVQFNPQLKGIRGRLMKWHTKRTAKLLKNLGALPGCSLLDIGCGGGEKLAILRDELKLKVVGVEPNKHAVNNARESLGLEVYQSVFPCNNISKRNFDFIRINHVLEHVQEPVKLLDDIHASLNPGGWVIGETENIDCLSSKVFSRYWSLLHYPYHLYYFDKQSLNKVFEMSTFKGARINSVADPTAWSLSLQNYLRRKKQRNEIMAARMHGYLLVTVMSLPIAWLEKIRGEGPVFEFWARKDT